MFELNKYEKQVETNISICFILMLMSDLGTAVAWIGLTACATLFGQLVYYPFGARKKTNIYLCRGGFFICFIGVYLLIGLFII